MWLLSKLGVYNLFGYTLVGHNYIDLDNAIYHQLDNYHYYILLNNHQDQRKK